MLNVDTERSDFWRKLYHKGSSAPVTELAHLLVKKEMASNCFIRERQGRAVKKSAAADAHCLGEVCTSTCPCAGATVECSQPQSVVQMGNGTGFCEAEQTCGGSGMHWQSAEGSSQFHRCSFQRIMANQKADHQQYGDVLLMS